jgi:hypothetical protein
VQAEQREQERAEKSHYLFRKLIALWPIISKYVRTIFRYFISFSEMISVADF